MNNVIDITNIQNKLCNSLKESGWYNLFKTFILSKDFENILEQLYNESIEGKRFTPKLADIFKAFTECPYKDLHTIFITREPFINVGIANGIAFDSSNTNKEYGMVIELFNAIQRTVYFGEYYDRCIELKRWSNQGILLLNANLTAQIGKKNSHTELWKPFTAFLLDSLNTINQGLIFIFIGEQVKQLAGLISNQVHYKYYLDYLKNGQPWDSKNIFPVISELVQKNYNYKIIW